jgi:hypothetical protein
MKKLILMLLFWLACLMLLDAQSYDKSVKVQDFGTFDRQLSPVNKISISSYVNKKNILTYANYEQKQKTLVDLPKYRYELVLKSNSLFNGVLTKTWIYGARVFVGDREVTRDQFPNGFTAIIGTEPTVIYYYESSVDTVNIKITWKNSIYFRTDN